MTTPQKPRAVERGPDGRIIKGSGAMNPGGRPKGYAEFREKCRAHTDASIATLVAALSDEKLCVQAAATLIAYGWGKPQAAPEDLDALKDVGPAAPRELVVAALESMRKPHD